MTTIPIKCKTFGDIYRLIEARAPINGETLTNDRNIIKGFVNQWYQIIGTERNWWWRKRDRSFIFDVPKTTGTVAVVADSRSVTFTGLTILNADIGSSLRIGSEEELYRIIGVDVANNKAFLETTYAGSTNASATFKLYKYEFALPPDFDTLTQVYCHGLISNKGQLTKKTVLEFNRLLSRSSDYSSIPSFYCLDGVMQNPNSNLAPLDEMITNYDFLGGEISSEEYQVSKIRLFPIQPDKKRPIHINYTSMIKTMTDDDECPLIPVDDRWVLVHYGLGSWYNHKKQWQAASGEFAIGRGLLKDMREEHRKSDPSPKIIYDASPNVRSHELSSAEDEFISSRSLEY